MDDPSGQAWHTVSETAFHCHILESCQPLSCSSGQDLSIIGFYYYLPSQTIVSPASVSLSVISLIPV